MIKLFIKVKERGVVADDEDETDRQKQCVM